MNLPGRRYFFKSAAIPAQLFISLHLFLFLPFSLYKNSITFWNYNFSDFLVILVPLCLIGYLLLSLPMLLLKPTWHKRYAAFLTGIAFAAWASNWFVGSEGSLDGVSFELLSDETQYYLNLGVIFLVGLSFGVWGYFKPKMTSTILVMACFLYSLMVVFGASMGTKQRFLDHQPSQIELTTFSKQKNVLVFMLDSFQSDFLEEIFREKPLLAKELNGFTFYVNATSTAPITLYSLPTIHSGHAYQLGQTLQDFYQKNVNESSFVKSLHDHHYRAMILNPYLGYSPLGVSRVNQTYLSCPRWGAFCEVVQLINYSFFNSVPHVFKKYIYNQGNWLLSQYFPPSGILSHQILSTLAKHVATDSKEPTIKFLHLFNTHAPAVLDESCQVLSSPKWNRRLAVHQTVCAMGQVVNVLQALKQQGIYDQTAIFIIADHGIGRVANEPNANIGALANPLLLYKPFQATNDLKVSDALVSLIDIKSMVCEATHDCGNKDDKRTSLASILKARKGLPFNHVKETSSMDRRVFVYEINGPPLKMSSWRKVPPMGKPVHKLAVLDDDFLDYAGLGWLATGDEKKQRWTYGPQAFLYLPLPQGQDTQISFVAATHSENSQQTISVWVNDHFVTQLSLPRNEYRHFQFTIPKEIITKKPTQIQFRFSKWNLVTEAKSDIPFAVAFYGDLEVKVKKS
ncbi:MAG: sulfatase-like hydrolase/transferase [Legionellales bacterium]|nr:sulfatase-like hydrolase/transferase [Legionellales bacterium]